MPIASAFPMHLLYLLMPVLAGTAFATIGVAYQAAQRRGTGPVPVMLIIAFFGSIFFALRTGVSPWHALTLPVLVFGLVAGLSQYLTIRGMNLGMRLGPFSAMWCMVSMGFAPVIIYDAIVKQAMPTLPQMLAILCAVFCCIIASTGLPSAGGARPGRMRFLAYGLLLLAVLILNALMTIGIQQLSGPDSAAARACFTCLLYFAIGGACLADTIVVGNAAKTLRLALIPGVIASVGSIGGVLAICSATDHTGAAAVLISSQVTLLLPMLAAVLVFGERPTPRWIATLVLGLIAIVLANR